MWRWFCSGMNPNFWHDVHCWHWYKEGFDVEITPRECVGPRAFKSFDSHSECCHCDVVRSGMEYADDTYTYFKTMPEVKA